MPTTYELGDDDVPSRCVYAAVSQADGRLPLDLPPLGWSVDPGALDALLTGEGTREITFEYDEWLVSATQDAIRVESTRGEEPGAGREQSGSALGESGDGGEETGGDGESGGSRRDPRDRDEEPGVGGEEPGSSGGEPGTGGE